MRVDRSVTFAALIVMTGAPCCAQPGMETSFSGSVMRLMDQSLTVQLSDGRLVDAKLPANPKLSASELVRKLQFGDQVDIECKRIPMFRDEATNLPRTLEVEKLRRTRAGKAKEIEAALRSPDWRRPGNLVTPPDVPVSLKTRNSAPPEEGQPIAPQTSLTMEQIRATNLARAAHLPNFVANAEVTCSMTNPGTGETRVLSQYRQEVRYRGNVETRRFLSEAGEIIPDPVSGISCIGWGGGFGAYLRPLFDTECPSTLRFSKVIGKPGNQGLVFDFKMPPEGCYPTSYSGSQRAYAAHEGTVITEIPVGNMIYIGERSVGFPAAYPIKSIEEKLMWNFVEIGGKKHLLPVSYEKTIENHFGGLGTVKVRYTKHRHFESETGITYGEVTSDGH